MNISQITSFNQSTYINAEVRKGDVVHAKVFSAPGDELNLNKEHMKMISIGGRMYKLETSLHLIPNESVKIKVGGVDGGKLMISVIPEANNTDAVRSFVELKTLATTASKSKNIGFLLPLIIPQNSITSKKLTKSILNLGIDSISRLLGGGSSFESMMDMAKGNDDVSSMIESWIIKSDDSRIKNGIPQIFYQLLFAGEDGSFDESTMEYSEKTENTNPKMVLTLKRNKKTTTLIINIAKAKTNVYLFTEENINNQNIEGRIQDISGGKYGEIVVSLFNKEFCPQKDGRYKSATPNIGIDIDA